MLFQFPLYIGTANVNKVKNLAVILEGSINTAIAIEPEYFYVLGVEMPIQIDAKGRFEAAIRSERKVLLEQLKKANQSNIISISNIDIELDAFETYQAYSPDSITNKYECIRRLHSLNINQNNISTCIVPITGNLKTLLTEWSTYPIKGIDEFWSNLNTIFSGGIIAHYELVVCAITQNNSYLITEITNNTTNFADLENATLQDWETWFTNAETAFGSELPLDFIPSGLTIAERATLFGIYVQNFFNIAGSGNAFNPPGSQSPPTFGVTGPIEDYISNNGMSTANATTYAQSNFPNDICAQEWFVKKIEQLVALFII